MFDVNDSGEKDLGLYNCRYESHRGKKSKAFDPFTGADNTGRYMKSNMAICLHVGKLGCNQFSTDDFNEGRSD